MLGCGRGDDVSVSGQREHDSDGDGAGGVWSDYFGVGGVDGCGQVWCE